MDIPSKLNPLLAGLFFLVVKFREGFMMFQIFKLIFMIYSYISCVYSCSSG